MSNSEQTISQQHPHSLLEDAYQKLNPFRYHTIATCFRFTEGTCVVGFDIYIEFMQICLELQRTTNFIRSRDDDTFSSIETKFLSKLQSLTAISNPSLGGVDVPRSSSALTFPR
jgi:hypothetical protein